MTQSEVAVPPAKPKPAHDVATTSFLSDAFRAYYARRPSFRVDDATQREWMVDPFVGRLHRHIAVAGQDGVAALLAQENPWNVYHSLACYTNPGTNNMADKHRGRLRWQVLVDIDVKPEPRLDGLGHETLSEALVRAKQQFLGTLLILEDELGVRPSEHEMCFSGAKGYHARITGAEFQRLPPEARAEIGRLIGGTNTALRDLFPALHGPHPLLPLQQPTGGLKRRIYLAMMRIRTMAATRPRPAALLGLCQRYNPTIALPDSILDRIATTAPQDLLDRRDESEVVGIWHRMAQHLACPSVDQSAIADVSRMVRLQGSLNGKTGLMCKPLQTIDEVQAFDPLVDANPHPHDLVRVMGKRDWSLQVGDQTFQVLDGAAAQLPARIAIVFLASYAARIVDANPTGA